MTPFEADYWQMWLIPAGFLALIFSVFVLTALRVRPEDVPEKFRRNFSTPPFLGNSTWRWPKASGRLGIPFLSETAPIPPASPSAPASLPATEWLTLVNDQPASVPHLFICGPTGSGKTTLATAILAARQASRVLILTPKPDDAWGGAETITIDDDTSFTTMCHTFEALHTEIKQRLVASKQRRAPGEQLTIVIDDYGVVRKECKPVADTVYRLVARIGRSLGVRLIVLSYSDQVKELGLEGEGETRKNFVMIRLDQTHHATLEYPEGTFHPLETRSILHMVHRSIERPRMWRVPLPQQTPATIEPAPTRPHQMPAYQPVAAVAMPAAATAPVATATPTTAESPTNPVNSAPNVSMQEQVAIIREALTQKHETGKINRRAVCKRVFNASGGASYTKVKMVLDAADL